MKRRPGARGGRGEHRVGASARSTAEARDARKPARRRRPRIRILKGRVSPKRRRRILQVVAVGLTGLLIWLGISLGTALTNPSLGSSVASRFAEWARENGGASVVNWVENVWYSHHPPPVGGRPPAGAIKHVNIRPINVPTGPAHLPPPAAITPFASSVIPGEGEWSPVGRTVDGIPAIYETTVRPDAVHTSYVVGAAWMDTKLLKATLYSGSLIPGGGPYTHSAPIPASASTSLAAAFNAGFLLAASNGGYYTDGKVVAPLRTGAASFVVYSDGSSTVGVWGRDVTMNSSVVAVRQNLDLIVDNGQPVPGLNAADTTQWGATLGNAVYVWRSGLGVTANGALVYVGGPGLNITDLANILARAGAVRAMELDINTDWVNFSTYSPPVATEPATPENGSELLSSMTGGPGRYFEPWWARDFITMSLDPSVFASTSGK